VAEAETGTQAIARFLELQPDLAVVDLLLPGKDGAEVCEAIRRELPRARILIVSSSSGSEHIHRALKAGAQGYLLKDSSPSALVSGDPRRARRPARRPRGCRQGMAERAYQSDLSPREYDVIALIVEGLSNKAIAARLGLTEATVKTHVTHIFEKLAVEDRTQAALAAVKRGIVRSI
jgi:two-component system NarL family response regulator